MEEDVYAPFFLEADFRPDGVYFRPWLSWARLNARGIDAEHDR